MPNQSPAIVNSWAATTSMPVEAPKTSIPSIATLSAVICSAAPEFVPRTATQGPSAPAAVRHSPPSMRVCLSMGGRSEESSIVLATPPLKTAVSKSIKSPVLTEVSASSIAARKVHFPAAVTHPPPGARSCSSALLVTVIAPAEAKAGTANATSNKKMVIETPRLKSRAPAEADRTARTLLFRVASAH